ncbi:group II intron reverse transcriptase/maturase [Bacillus cereus group sp. Bce001]|uniref:group II intron reverse transcriptase/maturase n=1 Tax=Bacillus cereus group sp. Bce001 TaxID=3445260 RepID=UPI003F69B0DE
MTATNTQEVQYELKKKNNLRYNEYYDTQTMFDGLYEDSKDGKKFTRLIELISDERNIQLAYRSIKRNHGSSTPGVNGHTIDYWANKSTTEYIKYIQSRLANYTPQAVRRVFIPKGSGKTRPLGIPTIEDRLIQQCIKQVLEPILEAKFHANSYGFRPNRTTEHAISTLSRFINVSKLYYIVDIDIKGFFDNVNHGKLLKQLWNLGIRDKNLLCVISKMLKSEILGEGFPEQGTPQGGVLSPLLSNVVLNELDWWISEQWATFKTIKKYSDRGGLDNGVRYRALRKGSNLKEVYIVRYADDFKLVCGDKETAKTMFIATRKWLKERLGLEISPEKSKITNVTKSPTEFLGFKIRARKKKDRYVAHSNMTDKALASAKEKISKRIVDMQKNPNPKTVGLYNSTVLGIQNYYKIATHINLDMNQLAFVLSRKLRNRMKGIQSKTGNVSATYKRLYKNDYKIMYVCQMALFPIQDVQTRTALGFNQKTCNYTFEGRKLVHDSLRNYDMELVHYLMRNPIPNMSTEYNDNRISLYIAQKGQCSVTGKTLSVNDMECHHKLPRAEGGTDVYSNLVYVSSDVHKLIHATNDETIAKYLNRVELDKKMLKKLNTLRIKAGNEKIKIA